MKQLTPSHRRSGQTHPVAGAFQLVLQLAYFSLSLHTKESDQLTRKEGILQASEQAAALSKHPQTCLSASCCSCRACWAATKLLISASRSCRLAIMLCSKQASVGEH